MHPHDRTRCDEALPPRETDEACAPRIDKSCRLLIPVRLRLGLQVQVRAWSHTGMATRIFNGTGELRDAVGTHLGHSDWVVITQERIDLFAEATGDRQWIHVDTEHAKDGPFGTTIAHGYLTMSISNELLPQIVRVEGISMGVNYGVNKVRFPAPVPVGSKVRAGVDLAAVEDVKGGVQTTMIITIDLEGSERPACVIEAISRYLD